MRRRSAPDGPDSRLEALAAEAARLAESERRARLGAEHTRRHLRLLDDASRSLMASIEDYEVALDGVLDTAVVDFASFATVVLTARSSGQELHTVGPRAAGGESLAVLPEHALAPIRAVMASGRSRLVTSTAQADGADGALNKVLRDVGVESYVVSPIQVRGLAFGALVFGAGPPLRGFRPSDQRTIDELGRRIALAAEGTELYREARSNELRTAAHVGRLRMLLDISLSIATAPGPAGVLRKAAIGAAALLAPAHVVIAGPNGQRHTAPARRQPTLDEGLLDRLRDLGRAATSSDEALALTDAERAALGPHWLAVPAVSAPGKSTTVVARRDEPEFSPEDESLLVLLTEIVASVLARAALHQESLASAARVRSLLAASPVPTVSLTNALEPVRWNPAAAALFAGGDEGVTDVRLPGALQESVAELALEARPDSPTREMDCVVSIGGIMRSLVIRMAPVRDEEDRADGFILIVTDETERRALTAHIQQARQFEAVGRLAGGVAHDFNNLLTIIISYADALLRRLPEDDPSRPAAAAIHRAGARGADVTRKLLSISRHRAEGPVVVRPAALCADLEDMLRQILGPAVDLVIEPGGEDLAVLVEPAEFEQALFNLAANARDAIGADGGTFTLAVRSGHPVEVMHLGGPPTSWVSISAADTGSGMDEATVARCVEPLFTTKPVGAGTGLGLALVYGLATQHGGELHIESAPGAGTTMTLILPAASAAAPGPSVLGSEPSPVSEAQAARRDGTRTVLVVDDDDEIRTMVARALRIQGFAVHEADSANQALALLRSDVEHIDLLVTDITMPNMGGVELARAVRAIHPAPVLFISGYAAQFDVRDSIDALPRAAFLAKPFTTGQLFARIEELLAGAEPDRRNQDSNR